MSEHIAQTCRDCKWSLAGEGVVLCPVHGAAPDLLAALEAVEWVSTHYSVPSTWSGYVCPLCGNYEEDGHVKSHPDTGDCLVGAAIAKAKLPA